MLGDLRVFPPPPESSHPGQLAAVVHPAVLQLTGGFNKYFRNTTDGGRGENNHKKPWWQTTLSDMTYV